ncbi:aminopeptidase [Pseudoxanthomonas broegbernensis]|uniref:Aminopeptidase n=1 Tax=Pseudoxanthomonas broegbernensis TaxID=83619 RepID=A0A7V8GK54_9GAMM|nr:M28 family metallopeptidase [Pseudoxanthomonas broegbernensis]KAF1684697.1 aminopeptidase [Pseudoxanthomonas broegbernensis]MBB6066458.1 Zn-dependent M28 family amino/carboxypeptidase [Pseudoxanthomonas broegbernensis]
MSGKILIGILATLAVAGCGERVEAPASPGLGAPAQASAPASTHEFQASITAGDFAEMVQTLASDEFEGRAPGSPGEELTVEYIRAQMQRIGLQPGNGDSYFQDVPMVETTAEPGTRLRLSGNGRQVELAFGSDMVIGTRSGKTQVAVDGSPMVFVGYGVDAPERGWNDYAGQDWTGKTVVMFVNDPGFHAGDDTLFDGRKMTYYGRWTYKFEEAARKGAAAALIVHDDAGASYGWDVVRNSWSGAQYDLPASDDPDPRLPVQGWFTADAARQLFADAGLDLDEAYRIAGKPGFRPIPLNATLSVDLASTITHKTSRNVVGVLPGASHADEAALYMAHWDHLGRHEGEGDQIYNGAVDNATGVAGILEIAEAFAHQAQRPARSVVFLAVTLEESGLLGSQYYVAHPTFPLGKISGVINLDAMSVAGRSRDMVVTGIGSSELEDILAPIVAEQGRRLVGEASVQSGFYFRSDHFNFAKAGVPALYAKGGNDLVEGGAKAGKAASMEYASRYHRPSDEIHDGWRYDGIVEDLDALYRIGQRLAESGTWPNWYEGNPFKAARDAQHAERH